MTELMQNKKVLFGEGSLGEAGNVVSSFGAKKAFVLAYSAKAGALSLITDSLSKSGIEFEVCDAVQSEPDLAAVDKVARLIRENNFGAVIAFGGGSVMDAAKAAAMIAANGGCAEDYQMSGRPITIPPVPVIMAPTTAGTGSEATKVSVIYNNNNRLKKSIYSPLMIADAVILDPAATFGLPSAVVASTGIDALSHAIESYVSLNATPYTEMYGFRAVEMIAANFVSAVREPENAEARANMLYASYFAGCALNAGIGIAHIVAQPVGGLFKIPHGDACSVFLPHAMDFNLESAMKKYCDVARALGLKSFEDNADNAKYAVKRVREIIAEVNGPSSLSPYLRGADFDVDETVRTVQGATGHIKCNPRFVDADAIKNILLNSI